MNLNKLNNGQVIKNYKTMCEILEEPYVGGKSKIIQLDKWKLYFDYSKDGVKFIINDVYTQEKTNKLKQALNDAKRNKIENRKKETQRKKDLEKKEKEQKKEIKRKDKELLKKEKERKKKLREQKKLEKEKLERKKLERRKLREQKKLEKEIKQKEREIKRKDKEKLEKEKLERKKLREQKKLEKEERKKIREQKKLEKERKKKLSKEKRENGLSNLLYNNICCILNKYNEDRVVLTKSKLLKDVGMINDKFGMKLNNDELEKINSNQFNYNEFNKIVLGRISSTLDYVFKKLSNDCLIKRDTYLLRYDNHEFYDLPTFREVDIEEELIIKDIYNQVLVEFGLEKEADIMYKSNNIKESFYDKISEEINNRFDCNGHCKAYEIEIFDKEKLKNKVLDRRRLNNIFISTLKDTIKNKYNRTNSKGMILLSENNDKAFMYDHCFLSNQYDLLNKFVRLNNQKK